VFGANQLELEFNFLFKLNIRWGPHVSLPPPLCARHAKITSPCVAALLAHCQVPFALVHAPLEPLLTLTFSAKRAPTPLLFPFLLRWKLLPSSLALAFGTHRRQPPLPCPDEPHKSMCAATPLLASNTTSPNTPMPPQFLLFLIHSEAHRQPPLSSIRRRWWALCPHITSSRNSMEWWTRLIPRPP
jgi:hypothetical protein